METDSGKFSVAFMPDGKPAPEVMTAGEVVQFLRLESSGSRALKYWRDEGELIGIRLGRRVRYLLPEVLKFLARKVEKNRSNGLIGRQS